MELKNKKIGIWGLGLVGQSAARFLHAQGAQIAVLEQKKLNQTQQTLLKELGITSTSQGEQPEQFLSNYELIVPSPGINLRPYPHSTQKWLSEVDLFGHFFKKPVIAITGTVGKTSITTLLAQCLRAAGKQVLVGGNIGTPLLDLLDKQGECDLAVIELSSFQLTISTTFAADLAIWTNFYPNHLDWHSDIDDYFHAKQRLLINQKNHQQALVSCDLRSQIDLQTIQSSVHFFAEEKNKYVDYYLERQQIQCASHTIATLDQLPQKSFMRNWLIICAALDLWGIAFPAKEKLLPHDDAIFQHRLEYIATQNNIDFYNDSKSTIAQATLAAVTQFPHKNIVLILGGLDKGVDRKKMVEQLPKNISHIICFGAQAEQLYNYCIAAEHSATQCATLEQAFTHACTQARAHDVVLFSPSGTSFDLFANYQERGMRFKQLVLEKGKSNDLSQTTT